MMIHIRKICYVALATVLLPLAASAIVQGDKFETLETKTQTYTNVTVTSATHDFLSFSHARGIGMVKVVDLTDAEQIRLGFKEPPKPPVDVRAEVNKVMARVDLTPLQPYYLPYVNAWQETAAQGFRENTPARNLLLGLLGSVLLVYFLFCYCGKLICNKTGNKAGFLMWVPLLQLVPLLRAAKMSPGWIIICLIPGLNIIAYITWAVKITRAREKNGFFAFLLLLPVLNIISYLYLALSSYVAPKVTSKGRSSEGRLARAEGLEPAWYDGTA